MPQRLISTFAVSSLPTGTLSCGRFGIAATIASICQQFGEARLAGFEFVLELRRPRHDAAVILALAFQHADLLGQRIALRLQFLVFVCSVLRSPSSAWNSEKSIGLPRVARRSATASRLLRKELDVEHLKRPESVKAAPGRKADYTRGGFGPNRRRGRTAMRPIIARRNRHSFGSSQTTSSRKSASRPRKTQDASASARSRRARRPFADGRPSSC